MSKPMMYNFMESKILSTDSFIVSIAISFMIIINTIQAKHDFSDIDIYLEVSRYSAKSRAEFMVTKLLKMENFTSNRYYIESIFPSSSDKYLIDNIHRDGYYEGLSKGFPGSYAHSNSLVPLGCWNYHDLNDETSTGMFINLGSNILIEDRKKLSKHWSESTNSPDRMLCSNALGKGYTSVVSNGLQEYTGIDPHALGFITTVCYGGCSTVRFNKTCPPGIDIYQGYQARKSCICSNAVPSLNCEKESRNFENVGYNITMDNNKCILETIDLSTTEILTSRKLSITLMITQDLMQEKYSKQINQDRLTLLSQVMPMLPDSKENSYQNNILILNLQHVFNKLTHNKLFSISPSTKLVTWESVRENNSQLDFLKKSIIIGYNTSPLRHISSRKIINMNGVYIGIITSMQEFNENIIKTDLQLRKWLIDDARCLKKLGALMIIMIGTFDNGLAHYYMKFLNEYIDVIIGIGSHDIQSKHHHRILQLKKQNSYDNASFALGQINIYKRIQSKTILNVDRYIYH